MYAYLSVTFFLGSEPDSSDLERERREREYTHIEQPKDREKEDQKRFFISVSWLYVLYIAAASKLDLLHLYKVSSHLSDSDYIHTALSLSPDIFCDDLVLYFLCWISRPGCIIFRLYKTLI